jgi:hypothetical protein
MSKNYKNKKQMKRLLIYFIGLLSTSSIVFAQEIHVTESLKTVPNVKCYWSYSVERLSTIKDSIHKYSIRVSVEQIDSAGKHKGKLILRDVQISCNFTENEILKKVKFKRVGLQWIAKFKINTNTPMPLKIIANYNHQESIMPLLLNLGTYPGEPDN